MKIFVTSKSEQLDWYQETDYQHTISGRTSSTSAPAQGEVTGKLVILGDSAVNVAAAEAISATDQAQRWDVFICHASEDKEGVALPLVQALRDAGLKVWIDTTELQLGDSLSSGIDEGLLHSTYGVVILSPSFFRRPWTKRELSGLVQRDVYGKVILPIWYNVDHGDVLQYSPTLADRLAAKWSDGLNTVVAAVVQVCSGVSAPSSVAHSEPSAEKRRHPVRQPKRVPAGFDPYAETGRALEYLKTELEGRAASLRTQGLTVSARDQGGRFSLHVLAEGKLIYVFEMWLGTGHDSATLCFSDGYREALSSTSMTATATAAWDKASNRLILRGTNFSLLGNIGASIEMTGEDLADALWNKLCDVVERSE